MKWPILDNKGEIEEVSVAHLVPPPPLPKTFRLDTQNENLNPNVAEFIPSENDKCTYCFKIKFPYHLSSVCVTVSNGIDNKTINTVDDLEHAEDLKENIWREVKRKNKEKPKKENKEKEERRFEREELEFHFDEELDQDVPTGRQNMFTTDL